MAGATLSMTTVRRGASIGRALTTGSRSQVEAERGGERHQIGSRLGPLAPDLKEAVLGRPAAVADAEPAGAVDQRGRLPDALACRRIGDRVEGTTDGEV